MGGACVGKDARGGALSPLRPPRLPAARSPTFRYWKLTTSNPCPFCESGAREYSELLVRGRVRDASDEGAELFVSHVPREGSRLYRESMRVYCGRLPTGLPARHAVALFGPEPLDEYMKWERRRTGASMASTVSVASAASAAPVSAEAPVADASASASVSTSRRVVLRELGAGSFHSR